MVWHITGLNRSTVNGNHYSKTILRLNWPYMKELSVLKIYGYKLTFAAIY